jgi:hypothetical protein
MKKLGTTFGSRGPEERIVPPSLPVKFHNLNHVSVFLLTSYSSSVLLALGPACTCVLRTLAITTFHTRVLAYQHT